MINIRYILIMLIFLFAINAQAQEEESQEETVSGLQMDVGYMILFNSLNNNNYYDFKTSMYSDLTGMHGLNIKFTIPTKREYLDVVFGTILLVGLDDFGSTSWSPGNTNSEDYTQNGGGIYFGVSPKFKGKIVGFTSDFAVGIFSFKEYYGIFNNIDPPYIDTFDRKASYGLGAMSAIGFYVNIGKIGINPAVNAIFSGGDQTSFLFYGFNFPLTIRF